MEENEIKIIFMGTPDFADVILKSLLEKKYQILSVFTQPDKKTGRTRILEKSPVKLTAEKYNIPVFQPHKLDEAAILEIKNQNPDLLIVAAYGKILPKLVLSIPKFGAINVHTSLLPELRGPSPIQNAILLGKKETGTTIMLMDEGIDTGDILAQEKIAIFGQEMYPELSKRLADISAKLLIKTLPDWIGQKIKTTRQDNSRATFCRIISREDGKIAWTDNAKTIYNKHRAFYPWPGIFSNWTRNGKSLRLKFIDISLLDSDPGNDIQVGKVQKIGEKVAIKTGSGLIVIEKLQLEGKSAVNIVNFLNGYPDFIGSILE